MESALEMGAEDIQTFDDHTYEVKSTREIHLELNFSYFSSSHSLCFGCVHIDYM
jgi:hypothetical protein